MGAESGCVQSSGPSHNDAVEREYEDEFAELDGQQDVDVAEVPRDSRQVDREEQLHDLGPWVLRGRPRGARALDGAIDG